MVVKNIKQKYVDNVVVWSVMPNKPETPEQKEQIENLISIRDDLWSGEKTREEIEEELREALED